MARHHTAFPAVTHRGFGHIFEIVGKRVRRFVGMNVDVEIAIARKFEKPVDGLLHARHALGRHAKHAAMLGDEIGKLFGIRRIVERQVNEAGALKLDAPGPFAFHLGEDRPTDFGLRRKRVDMGANRRCAVGIGATQRKIHARGHIFRRPVRAIDRDGFKRVVMRTARIRRARQRVALVEMGMKFDTGRPDHAAVEIDDGNAVVSRRAGFGDARDRTAGYIDLGHHEIRRPGRVWKDAPRQARIDQTVGGLGNGWKHGGDTSLTI